MLLTSTSIRVLLSVIYLLAFVTSSGLLYVFYSEAVMFFYVLITVTMLVMTYPVVYLLKIMENFDLEISTKTFGWTPRMVDLEKCAENSGNSGNPGNAEKPTRLDSAFAHAYMY